MFPELLLQNYRSFFGDVRPWVTLGCLGGMKGVRWLVGKHEVRCSRPPMHCLKVLGHYHVIWIFALPGCLIFDSVQRGLCGVVVPGPFTVIIFKIASKQRIREGTSSSKLRDKSASQLHIQLRRRLCAEKVMHIRSSSRPLSWSSTEPLHYPTIRFFFSFFNRTRAIPWEMHSLIFEILINTPLCKRPTGTRLSLIKNLVILTSFQL